MSDYYKNPPTYRQTTKKLADIASHCVWAEMFSAGKSVTGKNLWGVSFGSRRGAVLFAGGFHATEWLTVTLLVRLIDELAAAVLLKERLCGVDISAAVKRRGIIIIPCINPDGTELFLRGLKAAEEYAPSVQKISRGRLDGWNANIRGVDLNHNFNAGFDILKELECKNGIFAPSRRQYGGRAPESEPETKALCALCRSYLPERAVAFHSQGEEIFYEYEPYTPKESAQIAAKMSALSGYSLPKASGMASHGGFKDWFVKELHRPGFTVEIGRGKNPLPITDLGIIYNRLREMMIYGLFGE